MEFVQGILRKLGEYAAEFTVNQGRYLICFGSIIEDLEEEETKLKLAQERLERRVETARNNNEKIEKDVEKWQADTSNILAEVLGLKEEIEAKESCLNGLCPNWGCRYWLSKKAAKKTSIMLKLRDAGNKFSSVGHPASLPGEEFSAPEDFEFFQSSKTAFHQIVEALRNDETNLVGLYGMGGSGKTTLAKILGIEVEKMGIFNEVVTVFVSRTPNFKEIQNKLADSLGVELKEKDDLEKRAKKLYLRFTKTNTEIKKKSLVILDDVWEKFDLKSKIGFPVGEDNKHCKILLTTRRQNLCGAIGCQPQILLNLLNEYEGLALLKRYAGYIDDGSLTLEWKALVIEVARKCKGLPLAITTVGSALKGKTIDEWKLVSQKLKKPKSIGVRDVVDVDEDVYDCLKLSYDYLKDEETKLCFLLCSLYPEDYEISVKELVSIVVGLGLFSDINSIEEARSRLRVRLNSLKASCLLIDANRGCVKMHDIVRDVALRIASNGKNVFMSQSGMGTMEWSNEKGWNQYTAISLWYNEIEELPVDLVCPKLEFLFLSGKWLYNTNKLKVSDECFKEMKALKVLCLQSVDLSLKSLQFLTNLKTLKLIDCTLRDISYLEKLIELEIIYLSSSSLDELPKELISLRNLRLLDFNNHKPLVRIPSNLIRTFSQLEELWISENYMRREVEEKSEERSDASLLLELNSLSRLVSLRMRIDATCLPKDFVFPKLKRHDISVNTHSFQFQSIVFGRYEPSCERSLRISGIEATSLTVFKALFGTLEYLCLENTIGCQNILPGIDQRGLSKLEYLELAGCKDLKCILDTSLYHVSANAFTSLTEIRLALLPQLRSLWKGPTYHGNLKSLRSLCIYSCEILEHIFPISIAKSLEQLEKLTIQEAHQLKQVFFIDHGREENATERDENEIMLPKLRELTLVRLESLTNFLPDNYRSSYPTLKMLKISDCSNLTSSFIEELGILSLQNLTKLSVSKCNIQRQLFSSMLAQNLLQLRELTIEECDKLEQIIFKDDVEDHLQSRDVIGGQDGVDVMNTKEIVLLPQLKMLSIKALPRFTSFGPMGFILKLETLRVEGFNYEMLVPILTCLSLQNLTTLSVTECNKLRYLFSSTLARNLLQLRKLTIEKCEELEIIIFKDDEDGHLQSEEVLGDKDGVDVMNDKEIGLLPQLKQLSLRALPNFTSFSSEGYHIKLNLEILSFQGFEDEKMWLRILNCLRDVKALFMWDCEVKGIEGLCKSSTSTHVSTFQNLTELTIYKCHKLRHIAVSNLLQLRRLAIEDCEELEEIIIEDDEVLKDRADDGDVKYQKQVVMPQLKYLQFRDLGSLVNLCPLNHHFIFPSLGTLVVVGCRKIETRFSHSMGENGRVHVHAKPPKEAANHDEDSQLPPEPTKGIVCYGSDGLRRNLPPYMEEDEEGGIRQQNKCL